ncbi:MAG: tetrahydromethanopterin S-methyltransferase subunit H [Euryarchaeota archaeon]|nr:tetrahydromethanopterin S-methyltransferase subunit H [Euryarchaeota archaeon]
MYNFATEQKSFEVKGVRFGGQPGENPTALFGTVFYGKAYATLDEVRKKEVRNLIHSQHSLGGMTGNPGVADVFIAGPEQVEDRLSLVADAHHGPVSIDVPEAKTRIAALKYCRDAGLSSRLIYNSLNLGVTPEELVALKESPPEVAICLGYNPRDFSTDGRVAILETGAGVLERGLISLAADCGIKHVLLDTAATPFDHNACESLRAIPVFKHKFGLPTGCAIHNTVESWLWMKQHRKEHADAYDVCDAGSNLMPILLGASFVVYGPMRNAHLVFPAAAMADKLVAEGGEDYFAVKPSDGHPRRRLK